jgi:hypothetical protein
MDDLFARQMIRPPAPRWVFCPSLAASVAAATIGRYG